MKFILLSAAISIGLVACAQAPKDKKQTTMNYEVVKTDAEWKKQLTPEQYNVTREHGGCRLSTNSGEYQTTKHLHFYVHHGPRLRDEHGTPVVPPS